MSTNTKPRIKTYVKQVNCPVRYLNKVIGFNVLQVQYKVTEHGDERGRIEFYQYVRKDKMKSEVSVEAKCPVLLYGKVVGYNLTRIYLNGEKVIGSEFIEYQHQITLPHG